jgi:hypothetical protein
LTDDQLLTLEHAAEIFLGDRRRVATLRAEATRGNLAISKIGRSYWTTLGRLKEMDAKCLVEAPARASGSIRTEKPGLSSTVESAAARDSLLMKLNGLKKPSGNTRRQSTSSKTAPRRSSQTF